MSSSSTESAAARESPFRKSPGIVRVTVEQSTPSRELIRLFNSLPPKVHDTASTVAQNVTSVLPLTVGGSSQSRLSPIWPTPREELPASITTIPRIYARHDEVLSLVAQLAFRAGLVSIPVLLNRDEGRLVPRQHPCSQATSYMTDMPSRRNRN